MYKTQPEDQGHRFPQKQKGRG